MLIILHLSILVFLFYALFYLTEEYFVEVLKTIVDRYKLSADFAGATIMAVGSSAPELFTSLFAVLGSYQVPSLGAGTIVGSAIFNVLVIVGASVWIRRTKLTWQPMMRDLFFYSMSILLLLFVLRDGRITFIESTIFIIVYGGYVILASQWRKWLKYKTQVEIPSESKKKNEIRKKRSPIIKVVDNLFNLIFLKNKYWFYTLVLSIGLIGLFSHFLVNSAVTIAQNIGVGPAIVGLTVIAIGTSVPDLFSSLAVAKKGYGDMAISNAVGSNIFDILIGLGVPYFIFFIKNGFNKNIPVHEENLNASIILLFATVITLTTVFLIKKWHLGRNIGLGLIALYLLYLGYNLALILL